MVSPARPDDAPRRKRRGPRRRAAAPAPDAHPGFDPAASAFDAMAEMVLVRDSAGRITAVNASFLAAFGGVREDWLGVWFAAAPARAPAQDGRRYDVQMRTLAGASWIEWSESPLPGGGTVAVGRDVTETRKARLAANEAARGKSAFFAAVTHELRTPLSGALGLARLLGDTALKPDQAAYVEGLKTSASHALALIDDILDLSRLEAGKLALRAEPVSLAELVEQVCELLAPRAAEKGIELAHAVAADAPARISADPARLKQILFNLVGNAVKFTEAGGVLVTVETYAATVRLSVRDTGPGIAREHQSSLFEQFERGAADDTAAPGAGLGLAMVRRLAEAMGGQVGVESEPGAGALFWVDFEPQVLEAAGEDRPLVGRVVVAASPSAIRREALARQAAALGARVMEIDRIGREGPPLGGLSSAVILLDEDWCEHAPAFAPARVLAVARAETKDRFGPDAAPEGVAGWLVAPVRARTLAHYCLAGDAVADAEPAEGAGGSEAGEPGALDGLVVLVAEDDPVSALIARRVLERCGAQVREASTGSDAVEAVRRGGVDAALLDLRMPELDGRAAARAIRALPRPEGVLPLVALTANATEADREACLAAGMDAFLAKPIEPEALHAVLARLCAEKKRARLAG